MQGFNMGRYVPPDQEGLTTGNKLHKKHALGARASKLSQGILTVRFEMPFPIWCTSCPQPTIIGQGVRFNAAKTKVGAYHSSPIYAFRMRHPPCGGDIEIRTDPANTAYVVTEGGQKRDTGDGGAAESLVGGAEQMVKIQLDRERDAARESAFSNLERTIEHRAMLEGARERIGELEEAGARAWEDPYTQNQRLRRAFRVGRREREKNAAVAEDLKDRMSLGIELVATSEDDARRAALVDFGEVQGEGPVERVLAQPLFAMAKSAVGVKPSDQAKGKKLKSDIVAAKARDGLVSEIVGNTRMLKDPFMEAKSKDVAKGHSLLAGVKRKRDAQGNLGPPREVVSPASTKSTPVAPLVSYDSD